MLSLPAWMLGNCACLVTFTVFLVDSDGDRSLIRFYPEYARKSQLYRMLWQFPAGFVEPLSLSRSSFSETTDISEPPPTDSSMDHCY